MYFTAGGFEFTENGQIKRHPDTQGSKGVVINTSPKVIGIFLSDYLHLYTLVWKKDNGTRLYEFTILDNKPYTFRFNESNAIQTDRSDLWTSIFTATDNFIFLMNREDSYVAIVYRDLETILLNWEKVSHVDPPSFSPFVEVHPQIALIFHPEGFTYPKPYLQTAI